MSRMMILIGFIWLQAATGCAVQKRYIQTELYFGLSQNDGEIIPDSTWNVFVQDEVTKVFPDGFTELNTKGKWYDTSRHELTSEPSMMISVVYKKTPQLSLKIDSLRDRYKFRFRQQSVLRVDKKAGISF